MVDVMELPDTVTPTEQDKILAKESIPRIARYAGAQPSQIPIRIQPDDETGETIVLPRAAFVMLLSILSEMAKGNAVTYLPVHAELTTKEAADLLNVSRPYLITLLEQGKIAYHMVGTHRRVKLTDIMQYKASSEARSRALLADLTAEAQELEMGY